MALGLGDHQRRHRAELLKVAEGMRRLGAIKEIPELTEPELPRGEKTGTVLSIVASGVFKANAFYRVPYPGGAAFVLIADPDFPVNPTPPAARVAAALPQVLARYPVNPREALRGYAAYHHLTAEPEGRDLLLQNGAGPGVLARFDPEGKLLALEGA